MQGLKVYIKIYNKIIINMRVLNLRQQIRINSRFHLDMGETNEYAVNLE